jgi:ABC-2 type transport system permease protein
VQTVIFGATWTGASLAEDLQKGIIDRFRSLPMSRSAVLIGRTTADVGINLVTFVVMAVTGLLVGWRVRGSALDALLAVLLLLAFAYSISWVMAVVGLLVRTPEVVNNASFIVIFPLTFIANTFVPTDNLPGPIKWFAQHNPVSSVTQAARELFGNTSPAYPPPDVWPLQHPVTYSLIWIVVILVVAIPLAVNQYRRAAAR